MRKAKLPNFNSSEIEEVDFNQFINFFIRNKILIGTFTILFFVISCIYALSKKRIWQGQFEIVVNSNKSSNKLGNLGNPIFSSILGSQLSQSYGLTTEVGILESPSVLMPIFDFVKIQNKKINPKNNLIFSKWKSDNLKIKLKNKTSILNISYKDSNKGLILPVLNKITDAYQKYSGRSKKRELEITTNYLNDQINEYKIKSRNSLKLAQDFAIENDLNFLSSNLFKNSNSTMPFSKLNSSSITNSINNSSNKSLSQNIDIEGQRIKSSNQIRKIDSQIKKINELTNSQELQYISLIVPALGEEGLPDNLKEIEKEIIERKVLFTDRDEGIRKLEERKRLMINLLKNRAIGLLEAEKIIEKAKMEASTRPKDVFLRYKELFREAVRDETTQVQLENQLRITELEKAKFLEPWELITKPTLLKKPVAPKRRNIALSGMFIGLSLGTILGLYKEIKSGKIYSNKDLENILNRKIIECNFDNIGKNLILSQIICDDKIKKINIIYSGLLNKTQIEKMRNFFQAKNIKREVIFENNISIINPADVNFLLTNTVFSKSHFKDLNTILNVYEIDIFGIILSDQIKLNEVDK